MNCIVGGGGFSFSVQTVEAKNLCTCTIFTYVHISTCTSIYM